MFHDSQSVLKIISSPLLRNLERLKIITFVFSLPSNIFSAIFTLGSKLEPSLSESLGATFVL